MNKSTLGFLLIGISIVSFCGYRTNRYKDDVETNTKKLKEQVQQFLDAEKIATVDLSWKLKVGMSGVQVNKVMAYWPPNTPQFYSEHEVWTYPNGTILTFKDGIVIKIEGRVVKLAPQESIYPTGKEL